MNIKEIKKIICSIGLLMVILLFGACNNENDATTNLETVTLTVNIGRQSADSDDPASRSGDSGDSDKVQTFTVPFNDEYVAYATLTRDDAFDDETTNDGSITRTTDVYSIAHGVKFGIAIYDNSGNEVFNQNNYVYPETTIDIANVPMEALTIIVYSVNSTTSLPTLTGTTLSTAKFANVTEDLMVSRQAFTPSPVNTQVSATLKHQFSKITSIFSVDPSIGGKINTIGEVSVGLTATYADYNFSGGTLTYPTLIEWNSVSFSNTTVNAASITSDTLLLISPSTTSATYNISVIEVNNNVNTVILNDLKIEPGHRYTLDLVFKIPCTVSSGYSDFDLNAGPVDQGGNGIQTIICPAADFGFTFDIFFLDNSFDMTINGTPLATDEIYIQDDGGSPYKRVNIGFEDGAVWQRVGAGSAYSFNYAGGSNAGVYAKSVNRPMMKIVIAKTGEISIFGSKVQATDPNWALYPMKFIPSPYPSNPYLYGAGAIFAAPTFNTITWNTTSSNTVTFSQVVYGDITRIVGTGYGNKIGPCN